MRTGVAYLGHHNPRHLKTDLEELARLECDDVLLAAQENDFVYLPGKLSALPPIAQDLGMRPIAISWGALNLFGGGRSSQFLLEHPEAHQVNRDGSWNAAGCYNNPSCLARLQELVDRVAAWGYQGYFVDEPPLLECYCDSCRTLYEAWCDGDLDSAGEGEASAFRRRCVIHYIETIAGYVKQNHPGMETLCCIPPEDRALWPEAAAIDTLDNLGTDVYWANNQQPLSEMRPLIEEMGALCRQRDKRHHEWLQCWGVASGNERRILDIGKVLAGGAAGALYVWAYQGQVGTSEACDDPQRGWEYAREVLRLVKT